MILVMMEERDCCEYCDSVLWRAVEVGDLPVDVLREAGLLEGYDVVMIAGADSIVMMPAEVETLSDLIKSDAEPRLIEAARKSEDMRKALAKAAESGSIECARLLRAAEAAMSPLGHAERDACTINRAINELTARFRKDATPEAEGEFQNIIASMQQRAVAMRSPDEINPHHGSPLKKWEALTAFAKGTSLAMYDCNHASGAEILRYKLQSKTLSAVEAYIKEEVMR